MSSPVISVENLGKMYHIGLAQKRAENVREALQRAAMAPFDYLITHLRQLASSRLPLSAQDEPDILWALRGVTFDVQQGEVLGIIGRNGAGKSTLLKILSRIMDPTEGHATIRGRVNSLLEIGTGFHPELTGRENIYLNAALHGMKRREITGRLDAIIDFAEIEKFIDTPVKRYSSGMYTRLAFAVAAHLEPEILIVDEVLAVGDVGFQKKCLGKMGDVAREGRTVLLVSHNMASIANLCQNAVLMDSGRVVLRGEARSVIEHYIAETGAAQGEVIWSDPSRAPGNDKARLHSVRILQEGSNGPTADVDIGKEIQIEISYRCLKEGVPLYAGIWLKDQVGTEILSSSSGTGISLTVDAWYGRPALPGLYRSICRIPPNFLNDKSYSIAAIIGEAPSQTIALVDGVLSFHVHDTGEMRKEYYGGWLGVVRPRLAWNTEKLDVSGPAAIT